MPEIVSSAKLNRENHCLVYPLISCGGYFELECGWKLIGSSSAPYGSVNRTKAIVFEKTSPRSPSAFDLLADLDPGIYWCHGDIEQLEIRTNAV